MGTSKLVHNSREFAITVLVLTLTFSYHFEGFLRGNGNYLRMNFLLCVFVVFVLYCSMVAWQQIKIYCMLYISMCPIKQNKFSQPTVFLRISVNLLACLVVEDPDQLSGKPPIISVQDIAGDQAKVKVAGNGVDLGNRTHPQIGRFNVLYDDYLRDAGSSDENDSEVYEIKKFNV